ncbi:cytochrome P450, partial [Trifolium medium]|nr:cytochrome P450 [Trifolium medium]
AATRTDMGDWNWLWKAQAPPKAKHLIWRICRECLPTRIRLKERRAWNTIGLDTAISQILQQATTTADGIRKLCSNTDIQSAGQAIMLIWVLWNNRNNWVWNNNKESGQQLGYKALYLWNEWNEVQTTRHSARERRQQVLNWQKPQQHWLKCNVDAGFHAEAGKTSAGWCVRDNMGRFVIAGSSWINGRYTITEGEAIAMYEAMKELQQRGYTNVVFETDSQVVENSIRNMHSVREATSEYGCPYTC